MTGTGNTLAEDQHQTTLQRFYHILSDMEYGVLLVTGEDRVEFANQAFCDIFGLQESPGELPGLSSSALIEKIRPAYMNPDAAVARIREIVRQGELVRGEDVGMRGDRTFLRDFIPIRNGGKPSGRLWMHRDITDRKRAEEALAESEGKFRALAEHAPDLIVRVDPGMRVLYANPAAYRRTGYPASELFGRTVAEYAPPGVAERFGTAAGRVFATGEPLRYEHANEWQGATRAFDVQMVPEQDAGGAVRAVIAIARDITDRKMVEEALRAGEEKFREIFNSVNDAIHIHELADDGPPGKFIEVNDVACAMVQYTREELLAMTPLDFAAGFHSKPLEQILRNLRTDGHDVFEIGHRRKDGVVLPVEINAHVVSLDGKRVVVSVIRDISERKQAEAELIGKNASLSELNRELSLREKELERALADKEVLLSEIHHRVKNNLTAFISLLSLEGSTEDTPAAKLLRQDLQNRARSMALIHETLYRTHMYNKVDMGVYLTDLVGQIARSFLIAEPVRTVVEASGVMLDIKRATPTGLIVNELVTNSFKYAFRKPADGSGEEGGSGTSPREHPAISLTLTKNGGMYEMSVKDNGAGLPADLDVRKTRSLGLKLVNFLARHQLRAEIEVRRDQGTEFIFRFRE